MVMEEAMVEEPTKNPNVPPKISMEEQEDYDDHDNCNDHENEDKQPTIVLFTLKQLEVLFKMNRLDFIWLDEALKGGSSSVRFKLAKPRNFDGVQDWKVVDAWFVKMDDYLHAIKVEQHSAVELAQSYLEGYALTWWKTMRQEEGKTHGYTWEFFKEHIELEFIPQNFDYISRCKLYDLVNVTNDNLRQYVKVYTKPMFEI
jgi:hypothetical protein